MSKPLATSSVPGTYVPSGKNVPEGWIGILALLACLFGFDVLTYNLTPTVWCDEVSFTEPAINYVMHGTYTSAVWQFQPLNTFPAVNCPLYTQSIIGWLYLFGTGILAVRAFNYFLMGVACFLFWLLLDRFNLVRSAWWRLLFVVVFHLGYGISFAYRCSRPDTLGLCLTLILALLFTVQSARARNSWLLVMSVVLPWVSLTSGLFAGLACFFAVAILGRPRFLQGMVVWAGLVLGVLSLVWFLSAHGVLKNFLTGAGNVVADPSFNSGNLPVIARIGHLGKVTLPEYFGDVSALMLLLGTGALLILRRRELKAAANWRPIICSAAIFFATPLVFNIVGHYAFYYSYTMFTAALILFVAVAFPALKPPLNPMACRLPASIIIATVAATISVGLPLRMGLALSLTKIAPRSEIRQQVDGAVTAGDVVYTDDTAFFEVKQRAKVVYARWSFTDTVHTPIPGRHLTQADKDRVNKLVVRADSAPFYANTFGGEWQAVTGPFGDSTRWDRINRIPFIKSKLSNYLNQPQTCRYQLQIFQRVAPATSGAKNPASANLVAGYLEALALAGARRH